MSASQQSCTSCGKEKKNLLQCSNCENAYYCDQKCQLDHWETHQFLCVKPVKEKDPKPKSKIDKKTCFFAYKIEKSDLSIFISILHARDCYVPGKLTFQVEFLNNHPSNTYDIDVLSDSFVLVLDGQKKYPKILKQKILKDGEMLEENEDEELFKDFTENENPRIVSKNGDDLDDLKTELKPKDHIVCDLCFPIDLEFRYENVALSKCESFAIKLKSQDKHYSIPFDQMEVKKYYKDFVIGSVMDNDKKKYPNWMILDGKKEKPEIPSEEDWKF